MLVGYAILPSPELHNYMRKVELQIFRRYGENMGLKQPPHIMFKDGFAVDDVEPFERYFDELVPTIEPFEIVVRDVAAFDEPTVVFFDLEQDPRLKQLQSRVLADLAPLGVRPAPYEDDRPIPYRFHATVAYGFDRERHNDLLEWLPPPPEFRFVFDTVAMFYFTGDEWTSGFGLVYKQAHVPHEGVAG